MLTWLAPVLFAACGAPTFDNRGACEDWLLATECGNVDLAGQVDCAQYDEVSTCDVEDYFTCLSDNTACIDDTAAEDTGGGTPKAVNTEAWASCAELATCGSDG